LEILPGKKLMFATAGKSLMKIFTANNVTQFIK
jgi:hypothetical protein